MRERAVNGRHLIGESYERKERDDRGKERHKTQHPSNFLTGTSDMDVGCGRAVMNSSGANE